MATKIIQLREYKGNNNFDELIPERAFSADYASADISKGTIEERLTKLGHKAGIIKSGSSQVGTIQRQGNGVFGKISNLTSSGFAQSLTIEVPAGSHYDNTVFNPSELTYLIHSSAIDISVFAGSISIIWGTVTSLSSFSFGYEVPPLP